MRDVERHGELEGWLSRLGDLERAHHSEDGTSALYRAYTASDVGTAVADAVDMVDYGDSGRGTEEKVALQEGKT